MKLLIQFSTLLVLFQYSLQKSTPQDSSYVAAVVEFQVQTVTDASVDITTDLLQQYVDLIQQAAEQSADIAVFPEMTLTRSGKSVDIPINDQLKDEPIPALAPDLYDEVLVRMSQAARDHQIFLVINVQEIMNCTQQRNEYCPEQKDYYFNTNVVFDRSGAVINRYRKINLFGEFTRSPALLPELGVFHTDFGVTFGHFICFDLMFQVPSVQVVQKHKITDIIMSTMWFSEMPYLTAVQIQEAYAYALNVNFLTSGANNVRVGSAGSGIYSGHAGTLISVMPGKPTTRLLVQRVPKIPGNVADITYPGPLYDDPSVQDDLVLIQDPSLRSHVSRALEPGYNEFTLSDKEVSCRFRVRLTHGSGEKVHYRAFVKDGMNTYSRCQIGVSVCSVVSCKNSSSSTCPHRFSREETDVSIEQLEIEFFTYKNQYNETLQCDNVVYYPSSLRINKFPLGRNETNYEETETKNRQRQFIKYALKSAQSDLVSFVIWGRLFIKDVDHNKPAKYEEIKSYIELEESLFVERTNNDINDDSDVDSD